MRLTCLNDSNTLARVLKWGKENSQVENIKWEEDADENPIMISSQKHYYKCTELLYGFGYRIPQIKPDPSEDKDAERFRLHHVLTQAASAHCFSTHKEILQDFDVALAAAKAELEKVLEIS